jgi:hypothetical protein
MYCDFNDGIYYIELEIKDTTDTARSVSYLGLHLDINSDKIDCFNFPIKVDQKRSTVCTQIYVEYKKYVVNQKLEHDELLEKSELRYKIRCVPS